MKTKLYIPRSRTRFAQRPRLNARIDEGLKRPLTIVSAPPGFGKTALLSAWRATPAGAAYPLAWVSLDEADNDPTRFWLYVIAALQTLKPSAGADALAMMQGVAPSPLPAMLMVLINELADWEQEFALVLDDYHVIETPAIHNSITFLLEHLPPQMHLVLVTRADPPLPLSRMRARGELTELREKALRFTPEEAAAFMTEVQGVPLSESDLEALTARTEGWAAGLQLAGLALRESEDAAGFVAALAGSHRYVVDYLVDEVLGRREPEVQRFLLETSLLDRLCGPLCDAVTGRTDSQQMLEGLELAGMFLVPLDGERRWYRYHHLFADVLRAHLQTTRPGDAPALQMKASAWHEANGTMAEAAAYALAAGNPRQAAHLVEQIAEDLATAGEAATLTQLLGALPEQEVRTRPLLAVTRARLLVATGDLSRMEEYLAAAEQSGDIAICGRVATLRSTVARLSGRLGDAIVHARAALSYPLPPSWQVSAEVSLAMALHLTGQVRQAGEAFAEVARRPEVAANPYWASALLTNRGSLAHDQGDLHRARESYREARRIIAGAGGSLPNAGWPLLGEARIHWERNEQADAIRLLDTGLAEGRRHTHMDTLVQGLMLQAQVSKELGDYEAALGAAAELEEPVPGHQSVQLTLLAGAARAAILIQLGRVDEARWWAERTVESPFDENAAGGLIAVTRAQVQAASGRHTEAIARLERLTVLMAETERTAGVIQTLVLTAESRLALGDRAGAVADVKRAVALGRQVGFVRTLITGGAGVVGLLHDPAVRSVAPAYVEQLCATAGGPVAPTPAGVQPLAEPLSEREVELLYLMADGLSNPEIAERLFIAVGTVKRHVHNILGKLDATDRSEAVAKARALGIL